MCTNHEYWYGWSCGRPKVYVRVGLQFATRARPTALRSPLKIERRMARGVEQQLPNWAMHRDIPDDQQHAASALLQLSLSLFNKAVSGSSTPNTFDFLRNHRYRRTNTGVYEEQGELKMPFNLPGTLVPLHLIFSPRLVLPSLIVQGQ